MGTIIETPTARIVRFLVSSGLAEAKDYHAKLAWLLTLLLDPSIRVVVDVLDANTTPEFEDSLDFPNFAGALGYVEQMLQKGSQATMAPDGFSSSLNTAMLDFPFTVELQEDWAVWGAPGAHGMGVTYIFRPTRR